MTDELERNQKLWEELIKSKTFRTEILPKEKTKHQLMAEFGITRHQVDTVIDELKKAGRITSRPALHNGIPCTAYTLIE